MWQWHGITALTKATTMARRSSRHRVLMIRFALSNFTLRPTPVLYIRDIVIRSVRLKNETSTSFTREISPPLDHHSIDRVREPRARFSALLITSTRSTTDHGGRQFADRNQKVRFARFHLKDGETRIIREIDHRFLFRSQTWSFTRAPRRTADVKRKRVTAL